MKSKALCYMQSGKNSEEKPALRPQDVWWGWKTKLTQATWRLTTWDRVSASSDWFRQDVMGSEEGEIAGDQSGQDRLYGGGGLVVAEGSWTGYRQAKKERYKHQSVSQKHLAGV